MAFGMPNIVKSFAATNKPKTRPSGFGMPKVLGGVTITPGYGTPKPGATSAPLAPGTSGTTTTAAPSPFDSIYQGNVNANLAKTANTIAGLQHQQEALALGLGNIDNPAASAPGTTLGELTRRQSLDELAARLAANRRSGGFLSSALGQQLGNIGYDYTGRRSAAIMTETGAVKALADQIAGAGFDEQAYEAGQYKDAVLRASQAAQQNPALGMPTTPPINDQYLIKGGAAAPSYVLTPPKNAPTGAKWSSVKPPGKWRGVGGGWWAPTK